MYNNIIRCNRNKLYIIRSYNLTTFALTGIMLSYSMTSNNSSRWINVNGHVLGAILYNNLKKMNLYQMIIVHDKHTDVDKDNTEEERTEKRSSVVFSDEQA
eukprot:338522_1